MGFLGFLYRQMFTPPQPIPASINLAGQTAIVTGANVGLGLEASRDLIAHQVSRIILGVRNVTKGEEAKADLARSNPACTIEVWPIDMQSYDSIAEFAKKSQGLDQLDIVILNAGVKKLEFSKSSYGHEINVQVNHLGTSMLSMLLLDVLNQLTLRRPRTYPAHMTVVTSEMHMWTPFSEKDASHILRRMDEKDSFSADRYPTSKLLNVLWTRELAGKVSPSEVIINCVNPGFCLSSLHRDEDSALFWLFAKMFAWTSEQGAQCIVDAVTVKGVNTHGQYLSEQHITQPSMFVLSNEGEKVQKKLFQETVDLLKVEAPYVKLSMG